MANEATLFEHDDGRYAVGTGSPAFTHDNPAWHRVGPVDVSALTAPVATEQAQAVAEEANMFWNDADPERSADSIHEVIEREWSDGLLQIGDVIEIQRATRLSNIKVELVPDPKDEDGFDYEIMPAHLAASPEAAPAAMEVKPKKTDAEAYIELAEAMGYTGGDACMLSPEEWAADLQHDAKLHRAAATPAAPSAVTDEHANLRGQQAEAVMPQIGSLLDAWEGIDNDTKGILREQAPGLVKWLGSINRAMAADAALAQPASNEKDDRAAIQAKVDRHNLSLMRRFTSMWHADAVRLGYGGVTSMLEAQLLAKNDRQASTFLNRADAQWEENGRLLGRAISVFGDVLGDIGDWEDKALAEAVGEARNGLLRVAMTDKPSNICADAALAKAAPVQQDAPAPSMVGDAKGGA